VVRISTCVSEMLGRVCAGSKGREGRRSRCEAQLASSGHAKVCESTEFTDLTCTHKLCQRVRSIIDRRRVSTNKHVVSRYVHELFDNIDIGRNVATPNHACHLTSPLLQACNARYDTHPHCSYSRAVSQKQRISQSFFPATSCILCHYLPTTATRLACISLHRPSDHRRPVMLLSLLLASYNRILAAFCLTPLLPSPPFEQTK
jgi:hypothetical protein